MDLTDWEARDKLARSNRGQTIEPTRDHATLLMRSYWRMSDCEFGAAEMDGKRPYGNSDVEGDLAELLPHLDDQARLRVHCELPAVLTWMCTPAALVRLVPARDDATSKAPIHHSYEDGEAE